jgi:hypothetical protein
LWGLRSLLESECSRERKESDDNHTTYSP